MLTVHHLQRSQSERIVWLCEELGLDYELKRHLRDPYFSPPALKELTPLGAAPVVVDGAVTLAESGACAEYIMQKHGNGDLALKPHHPNYADYLYWFHFANGTLQPTVARSTVMQHVELPADDAVKANLDERLHSVLGHVDQRLGEARWLAGHEFTAADVMNVFSLTTMRVFFPLDLSRYRNILSYLHRVRERGGYRRAMEKAEPGFEPAVGGAPPEAFRAGDK